MAKLSDRLFVGVGGHVVAIDPGTGEEIWRTRLKASSIATLSVSGNRLYGAAGGELFCLDPSTGEVVWRNRLKGLGMGIVAFAASSDVVAVSVAEQQRRAAAASM